MSDASRRSIWRCPTSAGTCALPTRSVCASRPQSPRSPARRTLVQSTPNLRRSSSTPIAMTSRLSATTWPFPAGHRPRPAPYRPSSIPPDAAACRAVRAAMPTTGFSGPPTRMPTGGRPRRGRWRRTAPPGSSTRPSCTACCRPCAPISPPSTPTPLSRRSSRMPARGCARRVLSS